MIYYSSDGIPIPTWDIETQPGVLCKPCSAAVNPSFKVNKKVFHPAGRPCMCKENSDERQQLPDSDRTG
jgi:hypothetical protein